jgi:hypothetical protein
MEYLLAQILRQSNPLVAVIFLTAVCELIVHMGAPDTVFIAVSVHISEMEWFTTVKI